MPVLAPGQLARQNTNQWSNRFTILLADYHFPTLVAEVDALLDSFEGGGYDPFLCAQDIPGTLEVAGSWEAWREEDGTERGEAAVNVSQVWNPGSDFESVRDLTVHLVTVNGRWLINEIVCPVSSEAEPRTPDAVDPGYLPDTAVVGLMFGESVKMVQVEFVQENGRWLIDDIAEAVAPDAAYSPK